MRGGRKAARGRPGNRARCKAEKSERGQTGMREYTVAEVSRMAGVSARTLHHYDAIGLLKPARVTGAGYRLYNDASLRRLQSILLFRELEFPLKQIAAMLDSPGFDPQEALGQQIRLLELRTAHTQKLIGLARRLQQGGTELMEFGAFDKSELKAYAQEARERWGGTAAYREYEQRQKAAPAGGQEEANRRLMALLAELGALRDKGPACEAAQNKVAELQSFITAHYYTCTDEIMQGLGEMYTADERMRRNIDAAGGEGTAEFAQKAIAAYCRARRG